MNRENYIAAFSKVYPSDECIERIMNMTNEKKKKIFYKPLIAVAVIISLLLIGGIMANAATDGKVAESAKTVFDRITSFPVKVTEDGKVVEENEYVTEIYEKDGKTILKVNTENGNILCETPVEEYKNRGLGKTYTVEKYVDENGIIHEEIIYIGEENYDVVTTVPAE